MNVRQQLSGVIPQPHYSNVAGHDQCIGLAALFHKLLNQTHEARSRFLLAGNFRDYIKIQRHDNDVKYSFIVPDSHRLLSAGLPAHCEKIWTLPSSMRET